MSKWDWESNDCEMWRANIGTGVLVNMKSPFIDAPTSALDLIYQSDDYKRSKGWELLRRDFGCSHDVAYPYFVLYNKYTGLVRVFIYKPVERPEYSSVLIQVEPTKASWPATTSLGDALVTAPDKFTSTGASDNFGKTLVSVSEITGSGQWTLAEFIAGFDPNIQNGVYAGTGLKITLFGITNSNVVAKIRGRSVTGTESAIYNYSYVPKTPAPDNIPAGQTVDFLTTGEKFTKYGKAISDGRDQIHTAADKIWNSLAQVSEWDKTVKGRIKKAAVDAWDITRDDMGFGKVLGHIGDVIGAAGGALKILGGVIGLFSGGNGTPAAAPLYTSYDLELNGTINTRYTSQSFIIRTPGTIAVGTSNAPYYQCPLGIFNLRNTPEADVVTYERAYKKQYLGLDDNIPIGIRAQ
jgi:hypothetical protein